MRRQIYFVLPGRRVAKNIELELLSLVEADQIGFMAKSEGDLGDLLRPGALQ
jgi:hypothetical protein